MSVREQMGRWFPNLVRHWTIFRMSWQIQDEAAAQAVPSSDTEFLPAALEIIEKPPSPGLRWLMLSLCALFTLALLWSFIGKVDVIATAAGRVVPSGSIKVIQPIEIGYVRAVHVRNGQHVKAGDLLVELDSTLVGAEAAQASNSLVRAEGHAARNSALMAHIEGRSARFIAPPGIEDNAVRVQDEFVRAAIAEYEGERASLMQQRAERGAELAATQAELGKLERTLPLVESQLEARRELAEKGYFSHLRLLEYEQVKVEHEQNIKVQKANAAKARAAMADINAQVAKLRGSFGKSVASDLSDSWEKAKLAQEEVTKTRRRTAFQQLRAPVSGTVQQLVIATIGGVVQPAQPLMVIVPDDAESVVEAQILNRDIGFVKEGQPVRVKLEAFPFTQYGIVPGVVESISRDAVETPAPQTTGDESRLSQPSASRGLVYSVRIRLLKRTIVVDGRKRSIGPGLVVQAEIKTGRRRIIQYLLSPIARNLDEAARER
jgi:hemolysin D